MDRGTRRQEFSDQATVPIVLAAGASVRVPMQSHSYRPQIDGMTPEELDRMCLRGTTETPYRFTALCDVTAPGLTIDVRVETYVGAGPPRDAAASSSQSSARAYVETISGGVKACRPLVTLTNNTLAAVSCDCQVNFGGAFN